MLLKPFNVESVTFHNVSHRYVVDEASAIVCIHKICKSIRDATVASGFMKAHTGVKNILRTFAQLRASKYTNVNYICVLVK